MTDTKLNMCDTEPQKNDCEMERHCGGAVEAPYLAPIAAYSWMLCCTHHTTRSSCPVHPPLHCGKGQQPVIGT